MSATVGKYSVEVRVDGKVAPCERKDGFDYALVEHEESYLVRLINGGRVRCDVELSVDGKLFDRYQIQPHASVDVKGNDKLFVALRPNSKEGKQAGLKTEDPHMGEISAKFYPEMPPRPVPCREYIEQASLSFGGSHTQDRALPRLPVEGTVMAIWDECKKDRRESRELEAVGTGLGGKNDQTWDRVAAITDVDRANITTVNLRLAAVARRYTPVIAAPLYNPMPPPV